MIQDVVRLVNDSYAALQYVSGSIAYQWWLVAALVAGGLTGLLFLLSPQLWNTRYRLRAGHYALSALVGIVSSAAVIGWFAMSTLATLTEHYSTLEGHIVNLDQHLSGGVASESVSTYLAASLVDQARSTITRGKVTILLIFVLLQTLAFGLISYRAYQKIDYPLP